jgi:TAG lipase/steryl ester hydrolase/phospholipase A2/LPA acyltransferase
VYELPRLLNYLTAPNVLIWSAIAASCSVPFIFSSSEILAKDPQTGQPQSWNATPQRWIDGSVDNDLPMAKLSELFNVNHFIVSQVNPHIVPFLEKGTNVGSKTAHGFGKAETQEAAIKSNGGLKGKILDLAVGEIMHRIHMLSELGIFPVVCTKVQVLGHRDTLIRVSLCSPNDIAVISPSFPTSPTLTILR